ncbi:response regulator transcription factor [Rhodobacteraceae bacterium NNCM2]|nr:response regulator transcription factor [Coraliihabitans acroporae]
MTVSKKILLIDDDEDLREALADQLVMIDEFDVFEATSGHDGVERSRNELHDLIILDVGLPDIDGREVCRLMRKQGVKCPIIMLTGHVSDSDAILGLDSGANDYVHKPFKFPVLLARIRAQLRQHEQSEDAVFQIGEYSFRPGAKMLTDESERRIRLTEKETNILKFLYRAGGRTVERDVLLREVWGYNAGVTTHTLETHIYRLRQKVEVDPSNARVLLTESGGYRLGM